MFYVHVCHLKSEAALYNRGQFKGVLYWLTVTLALNLHHTQECLQAKDHLNYRYLHKRALYLCHVAAHLRKKKKRCGLKSVEFSLSYGGPLMPLLVLKPEG